MTARSLLGWLALALGCAAPAAIAQPCRHVAAISGDEEAAELARRLGREVIVLGDAAFECPCGSRRLGGAVEARELGGAAEARSIGGAAEERSLGGGREGRSVEGAVEERQASGASEARSYGARAEVLTCRETIDPCRGYVLSGRGEPRVIGTRGAAEVAGRCVPWDAR